MEETQAAKAQPERFPPRVLAPQVIDARLGSLGRDAQLPAGASCALPQCQGRRAGSHPLCIWLDPVLGTPVALAALQALMHKS